MASLPGHASRVRTLYKAILKVHRGLPQEVRALGDQYVKDEFKRHKDAQPSEVEQFMNEWTKYYVTLAKQVGKRQVSPKVGIDLEKEHLEYLSEEQVGQLFELYQECNKPVDPENPFGDNPNVPQR